VLLYLLKRMGTFGSFSLSGFGATDLVGERPRSSGTTAWPSRAREADKGG
jgi:hypothetical protein